MKSSMTPGWVKSRFLNGVAEIVMTEDEIGDVGNRGVNQRESHSFFEDHYRLVVYSVGWLTRFTITLRFAISGRSPVEMMNPSSQQVLMS